MPSRLELGQAVGTPVSVTSPVRVGGIEALRDDPEKISPAECASLMHAGMRREYQDAPLSAAARGLWATAKDSSGDSVSVSIAVIALDSPDSTDAWYRDTAAQWVQCQGETVTQPTDALTYTDKVIRTGTANGIATADLVVSAEQVTTPTPLQRALTTTSRYIVDVDVFGTPEPTDGGAPNAGTAVAVARLVSDNIASAG
ncbi:sensor domain-containing protein [Mycolicibacterium sp. 050232]|uniref:sensor domain-containing protein n=1 Tax=Mycolicibacterium sp. 050232 TaxID=3113982 RepID=UPI002E2B90D0|nr:sensor domain-containing protein [Mycolicibacterium sp. 050232]MED5813743.1 sensor domain-containing protein [Mycolicibacterium sp. 050232]